MKKALVVLSADVLANVAGGADPGYSPANNGLGRVGPGLKWKWLGSYYTPEALAHDTQVRQNLANGDPAWKAHAKALPGLLPAAASWFRARFNPGPDDMQL